jgi:hypothetical protein
MKYICTKNIYLLNSKEMTTNISYFVHWFSTKNLKIEDIKTITADLEYCIFYPEESDTHCNWKKLYFLFDQYNNFLKLDRTPVF